MPMEAVDFAEGNLLQGKVITTIQSKEPNDIRHV
jgi:hypothetical protein